MLEILRNIVNEHKDLQKIYLEFKYQVLRILIPELAIYETRSAGEILEMIQILKDNEKNAFLLNDVNDKPDDYDRKNDVFFNNLKEFFYKI